LVPAVELSWEEKPETELKKYSKGDAVKGMVLAIDPDRERILVSVKQLSQDHFSSTITDFNKGDIVTCSVVQVQNDGIEVEVSEGVRTFIKKAELSKHKSEQKPERFGIGDKLDAKITILDPKDRKFGVSIKALEVDEEKKAIAEYGSKDSGASLGEILGMALNKDKGTQE